MKTMNIPSIFHNCSGRYPAQPPVEQKANPGSQGVFWLIAATLFLWFCLLLGNRPLAAPDEGRYVEIPREMVVSGDYITPRLNGVKYFEKPPLLYWIQAAAIQAFGIQEWAMRFPCVFFAVLGCLGTFLFGRRFYGARSGFAACLILATSPLYYALARLIVLDMAITSLITLSLFSFLTAVHTPPGRRRRLWCWGFYACSALGVLTKGLMALAISGPVILIWALGTGRWKDLWPAYLPSGLGLFLVIAAPWHVLASIANPEFAYKYFIVEHFLRYTTSIHMRTQPFWFFKPVLLLGFFPWVTLLWTAIHKELKASLTQQRGVTVFLLIWAGWTFAFFSISNSKLIPYILPCFPPLALIAGAYWAKLWSENPGPLACTTIKVFASSTGILGLMGLGILKFMPHLIDHKPYLWFGFTVVAGLMLVSSVLTIMLLRSGRLKFSLVMMPVTAIILVFSIIQFMPDLQRPSLKPLAQIIRSIKQPGDVIGSYRSYFQDLPPYLNQIVTVVGTRGELEFGCEAEDCNLWMIREENFMPLWQGNQRWLIVARAAEIEALARQESTFQYTLLARSGENILITNKEYCP